jgi:hypothetical protein
VAALALLARGAGRSPAVAAGAFLAAALVTQVEVGALVAVATLFRCSTRAPGPVTDPERRLLALLLGTALAVPHMWRLVTALSTTELAAAPADLASRFRASLRPEPSPHPDVLAAMAWLRENSTPLDGVCTGGDPRWDWVPALAARPVEPPELPLAYRDEAASSKRTCRFVTRSTPSIPGRSEPTPDGLHVVFARGTARLLDTVTRDPAVTSFDKPARNPPLSQP